MGGWGESFRGLATLTGLTTHRKTPSQEGLPLEHIAGDQNIHEDLLGLTFQISPHAFFQVAECSGDHTDTWRPSVTPGHSWDSELGYVTSVSLHKFGGEHSGGGAISAVRCKFH